MVESLVFMDYDDQCIDFLVNFLLVYNFYFFFQESNDIMFVLVKKGIVKVFIEKLLEIFNKGGKRSKIESYQKFLRKEVR